MLIVCKFGGSSLCDGAAMLRVRDIVLADPARQVVVVSAAGKRHSADHKITDLLYLCHAHLRYKIPCWDVWRRIRARYIAIRDGCGLQTPIESELDGIYAALSPATTADALASRGEYLSAKLMADLLDYEFVDAAQWLQFDSAGQVKTQASYQALRQLAAGRRIVTPGFYGSLPGGAIHTFSRGGSDVTGALAAAALEADVYENWTDVPGVLSADPALVNEARPVSHLTYGQLQALSDVGMQVLHESAVAPVREKQIPLHIRSTLQPELPGTIISAHPAAPAAEGIIAATVRRNLGLLRLEATRQEAVRLVRDLTAAGFSVFHASWSLGELVLLVEAGEGGHVRRAALEALLPESRILQENLALLAVLHQNAAGSILTALEQANIPIYHITQAADCLLLTIDNGNYEKALNAAVLA